MEDDSMSLEEIRAPDESFKDRLIDGNDFDDDFNNEFEFLNEDFQDPYDINMALEISMNEYAVNKVNQHLMDEEIKKENLKKEKENRQLILNQFIIKLNYFRNDNNFYTKQMSMYLIDELEKFINCDINIILLFKKHYSLLNELLYDLYLNPLQKNIKPRISKECYELLNSISCFL